MAPQAFIWRCEHGHEVAISEVQLRMLVVEPRCPWMMEDGSGACMGRLVKRLREFPIERVEA